MEGWAISALEQCRGVMGKSKKQGARPGRKGAGGQQMPRASSPGSGTLALPFYWSRNMGAREGEER